VIRNAQTPERIPGDEALGGEPSRERSETPDEARDGRRREPGILERYSLGLALAMPGRVQPAQEWVLARPTGFERADAISIRIPIVGASDHVMDGESA